MSATQVSERRNPAGLTPAHPVIELRDVSQRVRGGELILHGISFTIRRGELVAIIGGSGTGKTTLLDTMSGLRLPTAGEVRRNGAKDRHGYVPQDDIIHLSLPLGRTLWYTAQLRLPAASTAEQTEHAVTDVLQALELTDRAGVPVGSLSGGQRKRASIAAELLTRPGVFFLDEPTSGLDPARDAELMRTLRQLADEGTTVVLTTHNPLDARRCDKIAVLAAHGYLAFFGTPVLSSAAALGLGLLISAAVSEPTQATLAMPMACFPQVLFVGAILPVPVMAVVGRWISYAMSNRWAFEGLGHSFDVNRLWADDGSRLGPPLLASYGGTFSHPVVPDLLILGGFTVAFLAATCAVIVRKTRA